MNIKNNIVPYVFLVVAYVVGCFMIEKSLQLFLMPAILGILAVHVLSGNMILITLAVSFIPIISYIAVSVLSHYAWPMDEPEGIFIFVFQGFLAGSLFFQAWYAVIDLLKSIYKRFLGSS